MKMEWSSCSVFVDVDSGEQLLSLSEIRENFDIINKTKKIEFNGNNGKFIYTNECRRKKQLKFEFE